MKPVQISIVIPVYNAENYLERCVESVLTQNFTDFELILINDGSKDNSFSVMKKLSQKDDRIKIYNQKNKGPALTRNRGISLANGLYLMFIDSDDYIDKGYLKKYYENIYNTDYDVVMGGYKKTDGYNVSFVRKLDDGEFAKYIVTGPVSKIYKTSFIKNNDIFFLDTNSSEDVYFTLKIINLKAQIKTIDDIGYNYYDNLESISNTAHKGFNQDIKILDLLTSVNFLTGPNTELNQYYIIRYCIWYLLYSGKNATYQNFVFEYNKLFSWLKENIPLYYKNKYIKVNGPQGEIKKIGNIVFIFMIIHKLKLVKLFARVYCKGVK